MRAGEYNIDKRILMTRIDIFSQRMDIEKDECEQPALLQLGRRPRAPVVVSCVSGSSQLLQLPIKAPFGTAWDASASFTVELPQHDCSEAKLKLTKPGFLASPASPLCQFILLPRLPFRLRATVPNSDLTLQHEAEAPLGEAVPKGT